MMKSYICILFAFMALIASGQSITCSECWAIGDTECCNGKTRECPTDKCMTISEYCNVDGDVFTTIRKTCGDPMFCDNCLFVTTGAGMFIQACAECCTGDNCNADLNYKRTSPGEPNGYVCPACYRNDTIEGCDPGSNTIECRGGQTECADYGGKPQYASGEIRPASFQGCATTGSCKAGFIALPGAKQAVQKKLVCVPATTPS